MRKLCVFLLVIAMIIAALAGCTVSQPPETTKETEPSQIPTQTEKETEIQTQPVTEETSGIEDKIGSQDTYWVASGWYAKDAGEVEALQPELWALDLMIYVDGTARFRDIHQGVCLVDDSYLSLSWERTADGELLFYSELYLQPVLRGTCEDGVLCLNYSDVTLLFQEEELPEEIGQAYTPAELVGTWLMVFAETEGYQWEVMPNELSSLVFRVVAYDGPLILRADMESLYYDGEMFDAAHDQEVSILNEALYNGCENGSWSVRIGQESPKDENGYPMEPEIYATLLDYNTLLVQQYYTLDGAPAVSYQTYWRFPELVTWRAPEYLDLDYTNWACTAYINAQGEERSAPEEMEGFSLILCPEQECLVSYDENTMYEGTWRLENGGVLLLQGEEDAFWFGGAMNVYCVETADGISDDYQMWLYYNGGILKLQMTGYG